MDFAKEVVVPAALSEILGRVFSFLLDSLRLPASGGVRDVHRRRLERLLGSIGAMVEEAEGRHITNHQLLYHLKALTEAMYRGRFALEVSDLDDAATDNDDRRRSFALPSPFNRAKRSRVRRLVFRGNDDAGTRRLAAANEELEGLTQDCMREFVLLVQGYPRKVHRPVTTTLYMDRCVFGRHVEKERIVDFLLQQRPYLSALAVVGAKKAGKTTLVRHACDDERVRGHFARVAWFETQDVVKAGGQPDQTVWASDGPEYLAGVRSIIGKPRGGRSLLVFEDAWPMDAPAWRELVYSATAAEGSNCKILFTCRDADLARNISTTAEPVVLEKPPLEEYWYYFKAFAFGGGADPREHPRAAAIGREICERLERTYLDARVLGPLLGANPGDARFWRRVLAAVVRCERRPLHVGVLLELLPMHGRRLLSYGHSRSPPKVTVQDVLGGRVGRSNNGGSEEEDGFTVHLCRETLYMDHWYSITFKDEACCEL